MTIQSLNFFDTPQWSCASTLEGTTFLLSFGFNQTDQAWRISVADSSGVDIYTGVKLVCGRILLAKCVDPRRPAGDFIVVDSSGNTAPPGLEDLLPGSGRCSLWYCTSDILAMLRTGNIAAFTAFIQSLATNTAGGQQSTYGQL